MSEFQVGDMVRWDDYDYGRTSGTIIQRAPDMGQTGVYWIVNIAIPGHVIPFFVSEDDITHTDEATERVLQ